MIRRLIILLLIVGCEETVAPEPDVYGCTDDTAANFDPLANIFDDSCIYSRFIKMMLNHSPRAGRPTELKYISVAFGTSVASSDIYDEYIYSYCDETGYTPICEYPNANCIIDCDEDNLFYESYTGIKSGDKIIIRIKTIEHSAYDNEYCVYLDDINNDCGCGTYDLNVWVADESLTIFDEEDVDLGTGYCDYHKLYINTIP